MSQTTVHLVGAHRANAGWGFENRLIPALEACGCRVIDTDFRQERRALPRRLHEPADLVLVCKGEWIEPDVLRATPCPTVLWYAEQVGLPDRSDPAADARRKELAYNVAAFDAVFSHDEANLPVYRALGARNVAWLPTAAVDPRVHRPLDVKKTRDVAFVGTLTPRRQRILAGLRARGVQVEHAVVWDPDVLNRYFNETRIVLNLHLSDLPNTETRVAEVLGAGAFLLTEELSSARLIENGRHAVCCRTGDVDALADRIEYYLTYEEEREAIAAEGHRHVMAHHTFERRVAELLEAVAAVRAGTPRWPDVLGVLHDADGRRTGDLWEFRKALHSRLRPSGDGAAGAGECLVQVGA